MTTREANDQGVLVMCCGCPCARVLMDEAEIDGSKGECRLISAENDHEVFEISCPWNADLFGID